MNTKRIRYAAALTVLTAGTLLPIAAPAGAAARPDVDCTQGQYCGWDQPGFTASSPYGTEGGLAPRGSCRPTLTGIRSLVNNTPYTITFWENSDCSGLHRAVPAGDAVPNLGFLASGIS